MDTVLELENVSVHFDTPDGTVQAVRDVSLSLKSGETLAIVGESGCGKSVLCKSVMKLLPGNARISGKMLIDGNDIAPYTEKQMRKLRGSLFSMLFQDPMTTLNPTIPIGKQITEAVLKHRKMSREDAQKLAVEMLHRVGIDDPAQRMLLQPHYFSYLITFRRDAPAVRACHRAGPEPAHPLRRRTHYGAGCDRTSADARPAA